MGGEGSGALSIIWAFLPSLNIDFHLLCAHTRPGVLKDALDL